MTTRDMLIETVRIICAEHAGFMPSPNDIRVHDFSGWNRREYKLTHALFSIGKMLFRYERGGNFSCLSFERFTCAQDTPYIKEV